MGVAATTGLGDRRFILVADLIDRSAQEVAALLDIRAVEVALLVDVSDIFGRLADDRRIVVTVLVHDRAVAGPLPHIRVLVVASRSEVRCLGKGGLRTFKSWG